MYSNDGQSFNEVRNGWFYIMAKDPSCAEAAVTVIPPDRREVEGEAKLPRTLDSVFPEEASEEQQEASRAQQKAPLIRKLATALKQKHVMPVWR
jgi:hypothetical protein